MYSGDRCRVATRVTREWLRASAQGANKPMKWRSRPPISSVEFANWEIRGAQATVLRNVGWARVESSKEKAIRVMKKFNLFLRENRVINFRHFAMADGIARHGNALFLLREMRRVSQKNKIRSKEIAVYAPKSPIPWMTLGVVECSLYCLVFNFFKNFHIVRNIFDELEEVIASLFIMAMRYCNTC